MTLIKRPECGNQMSDKAVQCFCFGFSISGGTTVDPYETGYYGKLQDSGNIS